MAVQKKNILNNFKDVLGQYCAINQFIELSKRCFVVDHEEDMASRNTWGQVLESWDKSSVKRV